MKVNKRFAPITIEIETEKDLEDLKEILLKASEDCTMYSIGLGSHIYNHCTWLLQRLK